MKWLTLLILAVSAHVPLEGQCALRGGGKHSLQRSWKTKQNKLVYNDQEFRLKGINWNGFESDCNVVHGLWLSPLHHYSDILHEQNFNALRIPFQFQRIREGLAPVDSVLGRQLFNQWRPQNKTMRRYMRCGEGLGLGLGLGL